MLSSAATRSLVMQTLHSPGPDRVSSPPAAETPDNTVQLGRRNVVTETPDDTLLDTTKVIIACKQ